MADSQINWKASETESIEPFAISRAALDGTAVRFRPADRFQTADTYYVEGPEFWDEFKPELRIELADIPHMNPVEPRFLLAQ